MKNKSIGFQCLLDMIKQVILNETGKEVIVEIVTELHFAKGTGQRPQSNVNKTRISFLVLR